MKFIKSKKGIALLATLVVVAASAIGAYAYFVSSSGSGTGSGSVGSASAWSVVPTAFSGTALLPGTGTQMGTVTVTNTSPGNQELTTITATIAAPTGAGTVSTGDPSHPCSAADFTLDASSGWVVATGGQSATYAVGVDEAGATPGPGGSATTNGLGLSMVDQAYNQNDCEGATPNVTYTVS